MAIKPKFASYRWVVTFEPANDFQENVLANVLDKVLAGFIYEVRSRHKKNKIEIKRLEAKRRML